MLGNAHSSCDLRLWLRRLQAAVQQEVLDSWTNAGAGSALAACNTLASRQAAICFNTGRASADRHACQI